MAKFFGYDAQAQSLPPAAARCRLLPVRSTLPLFAFDLRQLSAVAKERLSAVPGRRASLLIATTFSVGWRLRERRAVRKGASVVFFAESAVLACLRGVVLVS